jgi:hypothetical protein
MIQHHLFVVQKKKREEKERNITYQIRLSREVLWPQAVSAHTPNTPTMPKAE